MDDLKNKTITLNDNAKSLRTGQLFLSGALFISNTVLFISRIEDDSIIKYFMLSLAVIFLLFFLFYMFKVSKQEKIKPSDVVYFKTRYILNLPLKHLKLKDGKMRLINFKKNSKNYDRLINVLRNNNIQIIK